MTLEAEDVTDDLNPESRRDIQFFQDSEYAYQKEFLSEMLANSLEAGRALGGEYFSGPTSRGMGQEEQIAKGADLWLQAQDFLGYDDLITLLQNSNAQAGIDWAWSLQREPTYQKDIASIASYLNPFNTAFEQGGGAFLKLINPWGGGVKDQASAAWDQLMSADDRLLDYGQNPYGSQFKRTTGIEDWGDALWFAFDLFDIATLGTGGAVVQPLRRKLAEIMVKNGKWDNALGKKILGDDLYNDLLNRIPADLKTITLKEGEYVLPSEGYLVTRRQHPDMGESFGTATDRPSGLYTTLLEQEGLHSMYSDLGVPEYALVKPRNPLDVSDVEVSLSDMIGTDQLNLLSSETADTGITALKHLAEQPGYTGESLEWLSSFTPEELALTSLANPPSWLAEAGHTAAYRDIERRLYARLGRTLEYAEARFPDKNWRAMLHIEDAPSDITGEQLGHFITERITGLNFPWVGAGETAQSGLMQDPLALLHMGLGASEARLAGYDAIIKRFPEQFNEDMARRMHVPDHSSPMIGADEVVERVIPTTANELVILSDDIVTPTDAVRADDRQRIYYTPEEAEQVGEFIGTLGDSMGHVPDHPDYADFSSSQEYEQAVREWEEISGLTSPDDRPEWEVITTSSDEPYYSGDAHRSPAPQEPDFPTSVGWIPTGIEPDETFWGAMTRHMVNVDADNSIIQTSPIHDPRIEIEKEAQDLAAEWMRRPENPDFDDLGNERSPAERERVIEENQQREKDFHKRTQRVGDVPLIKRPPSITPTADEAHAFIETYMPPEIMVKVFPFGASDDEAVKFATILYDYFHDVDMILGRTRGKGFGSTLHSFPPFLTPNSKATDLYIKSQDTYGATLFDEQGVEGASAIKDAIKVTRNGEPLEFSDILELASDMDAETAELGQVLDHLFFSGETSATALDSPELFNEWWKAVQEVKMKVELEYPDLGVTVPEEILDTSHERAMNAIAFEAQLGEHLFGDIFVKNGKFYRILDEELEERLTRADAALTRGPLDEGAGDILDSVFPPEQSLGEEATEKALGTWIGPEVDTSLPANNIDLPGSWRSDRPSVEIRRLNERLSIAVDDFDMLMDWDVPSQESMDLEGFLEVIYRLREGTEQHAERLSWLDSIESWDWRGVPFEFVEEQAYGTIRDFVESSVRAHAETGGWLYRQIGEVTPENELFQLFKLRIHIAREERALLTQLREYARNVGPTDPNRIPESARNLLFIDVPLTNLGIPEKTRETVKRLLEGLSLNQRDAIARDGILGVVPTDENMSALKDIFIGIRSMVNDVDKAYNKVEAFREEWSF